MQIEQLIDKLINEGVIKREEVDKRIADYEKKATVKIDVDNLGATLVTVLIDSDNLGDTIVDLLIKQSELEERITKLEGGTTNA